jgi:hypothetical protein
MYLCKADTSLLELSLESEACLNDNWSQSFSEMESNLFLSPNHDIFKHIVICCVGHARGLALGSISVALAQTLWSEVEGVTEGLVDALKRVPTSHKDLQENN